MESDVPLDRPVPEEARTGASTGLLRLRLPRLPDGVGRWARRGASAGAVAAYGLGMGVLGWIGVATSDMPGTERLAEKTRPASIRILDRYDRELLTRGANARGDVRASELPTHLIQAVLAVEDERFTRHAGVDAEGIARAVVANLRTGRRGQGGSTLTQQLVKNVFLSPDKTYRRKTQEALLSLWLEREYTKDEILEMYLERVYFGAGAYGVRAASQTYFGKDPEDLALNESAMLAGLLKAPSSSNPTSDAARAGDRAALVLAQMERLRFIDRGMRADALAQPLKVRPPALTRGSNYFADWIMGDIARFSEPGRDLVVRTSLDLDVQAAAEAALFNHLDAERGASEGAVVSLDRFGGVLAMVGGADYTRSTFNRAVQAIRQPGSSFKPVVYLAASEAGVRPWDLREDAPVDIDGWSPGNFDGKYRGQVTVEQAFAKSLNTVAVQLSEQVGHDRVVEAAGRLGLEGMVPLRSLALGAQGASPLDLTAAYLPFATWGERQAPFGIRSVETGEGIVLYQRADIEGVRVVADVPLRDVNRLMSATVERGTGRAARVPGHAIAGKTGTTNDFRDAWFVGVSPGFATGVWVGNDANTPMDKVTGGTIPARVFSDVMGAVLGEQVPTPLPVSHPPIWADPEDTALERLLARVEDALP